MPRLRAIFIYATLLISALIEMDGTGNGISLGCYIRYDSRLAAHEAQQNI